MNSIASHTRLRGLDTLRALAILSVMLYHLTIFGELPERIFCVTYFGWMGVDLFFVLSGFLIGQQILRPYESAKRPSIQEFYRRRLYRVLPAYLVVLAFYIFLPGWKEAAQLAPVWKFLTFTMNFGFSFSRRAFSNAWSLCVEEHFYLFLPLVVVCLMRRPTARKTIFLLISVMLGGIALRAYLITRYPDEVWTKIYYPTYTRLDGLLVGVSLAIIKSFRPRLWSAFLRRGHALLLTGLVMVGSVIWMFRGYDLGNDKGSALWGVILGFPLLSVGLGCIVLSSVSRDGWLARARFPGAKLLATLAFTLYLTHKPVAHLVMQYFQSITAAQGPASWLMYAISCFAAAWLLHICLERPFLLLRDRRSHRNSIAALEVEARIDPAL